MKFTKFYRNGRIDKYVSETAVITFLISRNGIDVIKRKHSGKDRYIQSLLDRGYKRKIKAAS